MAKKSSKQKFVPPVVPPQVAPGEMVTIKQEYSEESGCWHVYVLVTGEWCEIAMHTSEEEADDCINDLCRWKRGE